MSFANFPGRQTALRTEVGGMSYPLYLNHWMGFRAVSYFLEHTHTPFWLATVFSATVNIAFAVGLCRFVDRQLLPKGRNWCTPRRAYALNAYAYS